MALETRNVKSVRTGSRLRTMLSSVNRIEVWTITILVLLALEFGLLLRLASHLPS